MSTWSIARDRIKRQIDRFIDVTPRTISTRVEAILVCVLLGLGLIIRLSTIGNDSLWIDEGYTLAVSRMSVADLWATPFDVHPPTYYSIVHFFLQWGESETALRMLSAIASAAALLPIYLLARRLIGNYGAVIALAVSSFSFTHLVYANNARNYALLLCLFLTLFWALYRVASHLWAGKSITSRPMLFWVAIYWVSATIALYTHNTSVLYILFANATLTLCALVDGRRQFASTFLKLVALNIPVVIFWIPWLLVIFSTTADFDWLDQTSLKEVLRTILAVILPNDAPLIAIFGVFLCLALGALATTIRSKKTAIIAIAHVLAFPCLIWLFGFVMQPIFMERIILPALLGGSLLIGGAAAFLRNKALSYTLAVGCVAANIASTASYLNRPPTEDRLGAHLIQNWRDAIEGSRPDKGEYAILLCQPFSFPTVSYYADDADIYVPRPDGSLTRLTDEAWLQVYTLRMDDRVEGFIPALDRLFPGSALQHSDWASLADRYDHVAVLKADIYCDDRFPKSASEKLIGAGYASTEPHQYPGVFTQTFHK